MLGSLWHILALVLLYWENRKRVNFLLVEVSISLFLYFLGTPPELVWFVMGDGGGFSFFTQLSCSLISYLAFAGWQQPSMKPQSCVSASNQRYVWSRWHWPQQDRDEQQASAKNVIHLFLYQAESLWLLHIDSVLGGVLCEGIEKMRQVKRERRAAGLPEYVEDRRRIGSLESYSKRWTCEWENVKVKCDG